MKASHLFLLHDKVYAAFESCWSECQSL